MSPCHGPKEIPHLFSVRGEQVVGMLHLPASPGPHPCVVCLHGTCGSKAWFTVLARRLAFLDVAVLRFDFRGNGDSQGLLEDMTFESQVEDARQALTVLAARPDIDGGRLGLLGFSLGGAIAALAARQQAGPAVGSLGLWAPLLDTRQWAEKRLTDWKPLEGGRVLLWDGNIVGEELFRGGARQDPAAAALEFPGGLLVVQSERDPSVPAAAAHALVEARRASGRPLRELFTEKSGHLFEIPAERARALSAVTDFFCQEFGLLAL